MKSYYVKMASALMVALTLVGCQEECSEVQNDESNYFAFVEAFENNTRTSLGYEGSVIWSNEDRIAVFEGEGEGKAYQIMDSYYGKNYGEFSLVEGLVTEGMSEVIESTIAVYPFNETLAVTSALENQYEITGIVFPSEQKYVSGSFSDEAFPMVALCQEGNKRISFKNIGGVLRVNLVGDYAVSKITLTGNSDELISGSAHVTLKSDGSPSVEMSQDALESVTLLCDPAVQLSPNESTSFYISIPPTVFENGFTVDIVDEENKYVVKKTTRTHYVNRTTILSMNDFSANPETPVCETGDVISVHTTSATITSTFNNIPTGAECGIKVLNNKVEKVFYANGQNGYEEITLFDLEPGTKYSYYCYVTYDGQTIVGETQVFKTEPMDVIGVWTCVQTNGNGNIIDIYTVSLNEDGIASLNKSHGYEKNGEWECVGRKLNISFWKSGAYTYSYLYFNVEITDPDNPIYGAGKEAHGVDNSNTGASNSSSSNVAMTRNMDRCITGEAVNITETSATIRCYFDNIPEGGVCALKIKDPDGNISTKISNSGDQDILLYELEPGTTYSYWAYAEFNGNIIIGEVLSFRTEEMNVVGTWNCTETGDNGTNRSYSITLLEDGSATITIGNYNDFDVTSWSCDGREINVNFTRYTTASESYLRFNVSIADPDNPTLGTGLAKYGIYNWNTGGGGVSTYNVELVKQ